MSLHYLIDGYNVIHQIPSALNLPKLEDQREYLLYVLESRKLQGSLKNTLTVVFDGKAGVIGRMTSSTARIIFSKDESADEKIKRLVRESCHPKSMVVVTDDRSIQYAVRASGAKVRGVSDFLKGTLGGKKKPIALGETKRDASKTISRAVENKITSEMKKIWLKKGS